MDKNRRAQGGGRLPELSKINPCSQGQDWTLLHQINIPGKLRQVRRLGPGGTA